MAEAARLVTAEELQRYPDDGYKYELVEGRVVRMSPPGFVHGRIAARVAAMLDRHVRPADLGTVLVELGVKLATNPDTVRAPDVAFIRRDRIPVPAPKGYWQGAADVAFEVLSPDDRPTEIRKKIEEYLARETSAVVVIDPDNQTASVFRPSRAAMTLSVRDELDLSDAIAGFRCRISEIFE